MSFYQTNFELYYNHKLAVTEIEAMIPFERDIQISLINAHIQKQNEKMNRRKYRQG